MDRVIDRVMDRVVDRIIDRVTDSVIVTGSIYKKLAKIERQLD